MECIVNLQVYDLKGISVCALNDHGLMNIDFDNNNKKPNIFSLNFGKLGRKKI